MENNKNLGKAAGAVSGMTLLSRIFGFLRDMVIAMAFGSSASADAFFVAFRIPNMQRRILGEGAVNAAFIPVFTETLTQKGESAAWKMTANLFNILFITLSLVSLFILIFSPAVITVFAPGFIDEPGKFELTVKLTRWMAPYLFFIGLAAFCMGILNTLKVFALPAATPILQNVSMVLSVIIIAPFMDEPILGLAIGVLVGGVLQLLIQLPAVFKKGFRFKKSLDFKQEEVIKIAKLMGPIILGLAVYEINIMIDTLLASLLPGGSISYLYYGNRLVQLPLGIFAVALGVALLPTLSGQAARGDLKELVQTLSFSIRLILFITIPATVGLIILREPIVNTLWERGEFLASTTDGTAIALLYYSIGLCAYSGIKIIAPAFYSLQDTKTPAKIGIYSMVLNTILNLILMGPLKHGGLALATSLAALFNVALLIHFLRKRLGLIGGRKILRSTLKMSSAAIAMGVITYFCRESFFHASDPFSIRLFVLTACISTGILVYALIAHLTKNEEWRFLLDMRKNK
ncbi:MAG: murein biosynthesis integral membrane protein MurJ [Nitrospina sp.]|jgi:putative peptidoglycan lipid II flippase|nr:murein biosynthesis integral membrane protein MurJ [Nitrospina sp.]MBT3875851.1 murein biosynthesis integral membrane protein MurJ [Nitrospina sp.]MBT4049298.1 murein biosynthesis integral membrane protein MurJ [Nitrospina sp.]MBT4557266.1 murein biosynthesis integral membrane protein MurJ [Nitrospina sp.]MBT5347538.1 murein biosynthesis integral membrane protein MurJ [Nitrospina sp.]